MEYVATSGSCSTLGAPSTPTCTCGSRPWKWRMKSQLKLCTTRCRAVGSGCTHHGRRRNSSVVRSAIPDDIDGHIERSGRTFIVTRRKDGSPTCHPMARFYADGEMYLNMYASSVKHKNLSRDPRITCLVTTDSDDPNFRAVIIRGTARYLPPEETLAPDASAAVRLARGIGMEGVTKVEDAPEKFAIELTDMTFGRAGQFHRIGDHRIQHRLNIRRRASDDAQDFARRCLLFQ